jgi:hypothetical protein
VPAGHVRPALGDAGVQPAGHLLDEVAGLGDVQGMPEFLVSGFLVAVAQVGRHGSGEQVGLLRYQSNQAGQ